MRQVLDEVSDEDLIPVRDGLLQGVTCIEQGLHYPAQATAAVLLTAMLERYFMASSGQNMTQLAEEWAELSPGEGPIRQLRWSAILWSAALALEGYRIQRGDPMPTGFSRHASVHAFELAQYRPANVLAGLMLVVALVRELNQFESQGS